MARVKIEWTETHTYEAEIDIPFEAVPDDWQENAEIHEAISETSAAMEIDVEMGDLTKITLLAKDTVPNVQAPKHEPMWED